MIQLRTRLTLADNSGAKSLMVIGIPGRIGRTASLGQIVRCVVDGAIPNGSVVDREKVNTLIVRVRKEVRRKDGTHVRFDDNAGVIIDKNGLPLGTRILGPVAREVKEAGFTKVASLSREVV